MTGRTRLAKRRPRGFSQVEVALAVVVLSVGLLGVFASFAYGLRSSKSSARLTEATNYGRQMIEIIRSRNLPFARGMPPPPEFALNDPPGLPLEALPNLEAPPYANDFPPNTGFRRHVQVFREVSAASDYRYDVAEIRVRILWKEGDRTRQVEMTAHHRQP